MAITIQTRRGTAAQWTSANPVLAAGEQGYETDTGKIKVGDGTTAWTALPYPVDDAAAAAVAENPTIADLNTATASLIASGETNAAPTINAALAAPVSSAGETRTVVLIGSFTISEPLVIYSDTIFDTTRATITLNAGSDCNMLRNVNYAGPVRDSNITLRLGTWDRGANGGTGNVSHSLFLRRIDGITIERIDYRSTGGKYGVALGDVTNYKVRDVTADCASDTVHITGPAYDGVIERVTSTGGDDIVAFTTTDYVSYDDVHGHIERCVVRDVTGDSITRVVLVCGSASGAGDGFDLRTITIENIEQTGTGNAVYVAAPNATTETVDNLTIRNAHGGEILLRHPNMGTVTVEDGESVALTPESGQTENRVNQLVMRRCTRASGSAYDTLAVNNAIGEVGTALLEACGTSSGPLVTVAGAIETLRIVMPDFTSTNAGLVSVYNAGVIERMVIDQPDVSLATTHHLIRISNTAQIGSVVINDAAITAADSNSGILAYLDATATLGTVAVRGGALTGIGRVLEAITGGTGTVTVDLSGVTLSGCNRIAQVGGRTLNFFYDNIRMNGMINQPVRIYDSGSATIHGNGWSGYTGSAAVRSATEVLHVKAQDFPVDISITAKASGNRAMNTNAALSSGAGPVICDGTTWKHLVSGATYV